MKPHHIEIVCRRGANQYAPENTYASARLCIDWAMDYLEIDVSTSKDGMLHVFHGPELTKTTNSIGLIFDYTATELDRLDAGSWFDRDSMAREFRQLAPDLALKMNAATIERVIEGDERFQASIIEVDLDNYSQDSMAVCRQRGLKVMVNYGGNDPDFFHQILRRQPD